MFLFKNSNGFYYLFYNCNLTGKRKKISTKTKLKSEAYQYLNSFQPEARQGANKIKPISISELYSALENYLKTEIRNSTLKIYESVFKYFSEYLNNKLIKLITVKDIEDYRKYRLKSIKPVTCNIEIRTLKSGFNKAVKLCYLISNPFNSVKQIAIPEKQILCFSNNEINEILNFVRSGIIRNIILVSLYTGMRINEVLNLQWKNVNFEHQFITVENKEDCKTKTGKIRKIPINEGLLKLLNEMYESDFSGNIADINFLDKYIFKKQGNFKYSGEYVSKKFKAVLRILNFPEKFHFHCLRHTFITNLVNAGANINHIKEIAGHSDIKTTLNYVHLQNKDLINTINKIKLNY